MITRRRTAEREREEAADELTEAEERALFGDPGLTHEGHTSGRRAVVRFRCRRGPDVTGAGRFRTARGVADAHQPSHGLKLGT
jgi:hypothetical protein